MTFVFNQKERVVSFIFFLTFQINFLQGEQLADMNITARFTKSICSTVKCTIDSIKMPL